MLAIEIDLVKTDRTKFLPDCAGIIDQNLPVNY